MRRTSELFIGSTTVNFVNALNKPPLKLLLSYQPATQHVLTIWNQQPNNEGNRRHQSYVPATAGLIRLCAHARKTIP